MFRTTLSLKHKFEVPEVLPVVEYLKGDPMLWWDDSFLCFVCCLL